MTYGAKALDRGGLAALTAQDAGEYLACQIGPPAPVSKQRMWQLARLGEVPVVRIGRRVWFKTASLDTLAESQHRRGRGQ